MRTICPNCKTQLSLDTINGSKITYKCSNCNEILYLSDLLDIDKVEKLLLQPPKKIRVKRKKGLIIVHVPVNLNKINYIFLFIFILIIFSIFLVPFIWSLYKINSNEFAVNIINIIIGIVCVIMGILILSLHLRKIFCSIFNKIKIVFSGNNICIYRGLGEKNENIDINFIKKIYSTKSIKEYKDIDDDTSVDIDRKIYIEIENKGYYTAGQALQGSCLRNLQKPTAAFRGKPRGIKPFVSSLARSCPCKHGRDLAPFVNKNTIEINVYDVNEVNSLFLVLIIKYFSYKKQGI